MTIAVLATQPLSLISLIGDERSPLLARLLQVSAFREAHHIPVRGDTAAQRNITASRIDAAITEADRAVLLIAEGLGCMAAAWWARLSPQAYVARVAGAMMIAPDQRAAGSARFASPRATLPFPSVVLGAGDAGLRLASEWGSRLVDAPLPLGARATSGRFQSIIARFTSAIVESDVRAAERLLAALGDR